MTPREIVLARLGGAPFDLLVVGGGIVGAGIARDAALRGLRVALVEQGDFASGTSSKTSKLIHGGLRYLEHGRLRFVFEALRERSRLRAVAPTLVRPLTLLLPVYAGDPRPPWAVAAGLLLYRALALRQGLGPHRMLSRARALAVEPSLRAEGLRAAGLYADCEVDDARLCLANILQAVRLGATCGNYIRLRGFLRAGGRVCGGLVEDQLTGRSIEVRAQVVVNATGPWSDATRRLSDPAAAGRLAATKGIHLVVPRVTQEALLIQARQGRRVLFLLPLGEHSLIGTTETALDGPLETLSATADEVGYLLEEVNRVLPGRRLGESDVVATYAGARPLLGSRLASSRASREHRIETDAWGLLSVLGGKYTTYRLMAEQVVDGVVRRLRRRVDRCLTDRVSLHEVIDPVVLGPWQDLLRAVDPDLLARLLTRYGEGACSILRIMRREPALARPMCPHHETTTAELAYAFQDEMACTITDALARRTAVAWSSCQGLDALSTVSDLARRYGGVPEAGLEVQVQEYHSFLARGLAFRPAPRVWPGADPAALSPEPVGTPIDERGGLRNNAGAMTGDPAQARRYADARYRLLLAELASAWLFLGLAYWSGASQGLAALARRATPVPALTLLIYLALFGPAYYLAMLPLRLYGSFHLEHRFGLSRLTGGGWCRREAKRLIVSGLLGAGLLAGLYALFREAPRTWPLWATMGWVGVSVVLARVFPTLLLPLFYKTVPLDQPDLSRRLLALCERAGLPALGVFRFDLGAETRKANAALAGLGATRRVLLSDTLLAEFKPDEIEGVLAHEVAHHRYRHIAKALAISAAGSWIAFSLTQLGAPWMLPRLGLQGLADPAGVPILMLWFALLGLVGLPAQNALSRRFEWQADRFAAAASRVPRAFADALRRLAELNLADPAPPRWIVWLFYDHPPIMARIKAADRAARPSDQ